MKKRTVYFWLSVLCFLMAFYCVGQIFNITKACYAGEAVKCVPNGKVCLVFDRDESSSTNLGNVLLRNNHTEYLHVFLNFYRIECGSKEMGRRKYLGAKEWDVTLKDFKRTDDGGVSLSANAMKKISHHLHYHVPPGKTIWLFSFSCNKKFSISWDISSYDESEGKMLIQKFKKLNPNWSDVDMSKR